MAVKAEDFFDVNGNFRRSQQGQDILSHNKKRRDKIDGLWQVQLVYNRNCKVRFHEEKIPFVFTSDLVFLSKEEAAGFIPYYIRKLMDEGDLPEDTIKKDPESGKEFINQTIIVPAVRKLTIGEMKYEEAG